MRYCKVLHAALKTVVSSAQQFCWLIPIQSLIFTAGAGDGIEVMKGVKISNGRKHVERTRFGGRGVPDGSPER
jgi:hypothetical protein